jgi:hypothetical protein
MFNVDFHKEWKVYSKSAVGFVVCVCAATGLLSVVPFSDWKMDSFEKGCGDILKSENFSVIHTKKVNLATLPYYNTQRDVQSFPGGSRSISKTQDPFIHSTDDCRSVNIL